MIPGDPILNTWFGLFDLVGPGVVVSDRIKNECRCVRPRVNCSLADHSVLTGTIDAVRMDHHPVLGSLW